MSAKSRELPAVWARRREREHNHIERTSAVNRYFDHWNKVNTRYETWTAPEYYKQAEEKCQQKRDKAEKLQKLEQRRDKLRQIYSDEKSLFEQELQEREQKRSRKIRASTETLQKIEQNAKDKDNQKRKLELEAKLYGRWRHGVDDENLIFESKSDNQVLAKLNWLDKQIEDQLLREKEEALAQERNLRLQEELNKTVQVEKERQLIREQEIKEIRALQEKHMEELKERQAETDTLKTTEQSLRAYLQELDEEQDLLSESAALTVKGSAQPESFNLKKIKLFIRKRSEVFQNQIKLMMSVLKRVRVYATRPDAVAVLLQKYDAHMNDEKYMLTQIEAWYESEAKCNLKRCEEVWRSDTMQRVHEIKELLRQEQLTFTAQLDENQNRQRDVLELRSTHLAAIDNSNEKLKILIKEQEDSPRGRLEELDRMSAGADADAAADTISQVSVKSAQSRGVLSPRELPKVTNSFNNLNLDVWKDLPSVKGGIDSPRLQLQRSMHVVTPDNVERPKFGRKRVAWT